ncbi:hypothetical protein [Niabella drilacis]|uniref:UbiA prenyltransferase family protein n=1 Tax=Niabella drilacis (strain DSM 25811 / CCM 8410 / CCUG 62505 / LMG 26954 / E90) TaxID=1285928 RepID=A0A1G6NSN8_NIADE|nr:hypothetical protein [Niabella drilacis]SDC70286.1 hypothetical protein SAMN04487894_103365 [Niabella drilacis]
MQKILLALPMGYFFKTRLNTKAAFIFHTYYEFLLGILLLVFFQTPLKTALIHFALGHIAFISLYEIGYIYNDYIAVRFEANPRKRLEQWQIKDRDVLLFILLRLAIFTGVSFLIKAWISPAWWIFYTVLIITYALHNLMQQKAFKVFTFVNLAVIRFYAPVFFFLTREQIGLTLPGILIFYVFFRTLTYMDSKGLLQLKNRDTAPFKINFYLIFLPYSSVIYLFTNSLLSLYLDIYFLVFWLLVKLLLQSKNK